MRDVRLHRVRLGKVGLFKVALLDKDGKCEPQPPFWDIDNILLEDGSNMLLENGNTMLMETKVAQIRLTPQ